MGELYFWSAARGAWVSCPPDEITWLDRGLLSGNEDLTLHRAPRCAGLRYVQHRWELFSRDTTYPVYLARRDGLPARDADAVRQAARHALPVASARQESRPVPLEAGSWLVSVGNWVLALRQDGPALASAPAVAPGERQPPTQDGSVLGRAGPSPSRPARAAGPEAAGRVRGYLARNTTARLAMAYYYQEFLLGLAAPQAVPMIDVVIALDLSGEGAVSDYKKQLQGLIWQERGHARDLADFLLSQDLLTLADLQQARRVCADNERRGASELARQRLRYRRRET